MLLKLLTTIMFLISGMYKLYDPSLGMKKLSNCSLFPFDNQKILMIIIIMAALWEIVASLMVYYGTKKESVMGCYLLAIFTVLATLLCHFPPYGMTYYPFISNVTALGGLLCLAALIKKC